MSKDIQFTEEDQVKGSWMKWENPGDTVKGTLIDVREKPDNYKPDTNQKIYEIRDLDDNIILIGGKPGLDQQMKYVSIGQIVQILFKDTKPPKQQGLNPTKIMQVFSKKSEDGWDEDFLKEREREQALEGKGSNVEENFSTEGAKEEGDIDVDKIFPDNKGENQQPTQAQTQAQTDTGEEIDPADEAKMETIKDLAVKKLGYKEEDPKSSLEITVMNKTNLAFIKSNYDVIIEKLKSL